jgi:hypothetical protein
VPKAGAPAGAESDVGPVTAVPLLVEEPSGRVPRRAER